MTPYCLCHSPSSAAQFKVEFSGTAPGQQSPVRGNGTAVPRVRFGGRAVPLAAPQSRGDSRGSDIPSGAAAERPMQRCLWPQHLGMQTELFLLFFLSWTLVCVPRECAQVYLCPQWDCKRQSVCCKIKSCHHLGSSAVLSRPRF